jgi:hypothetical protein
MSGSPKIVRRLLAVAIRLHNVVDTFSKIDYPEATERRGRSPA